MFSAFNAVHTAHTKYLSYLVFVCEILGMVRRHHHHHYHHSHRCSRRLRCCRWAANSKMLHFIWTWKQCIFDLYIEISIHIYLFISTYCDGALQQQQQQQHDDDKQFQLRLFDSYRYYIFIWCGMCVWFSIKVKTPSSL